MIKIIKDKDLIWDTDKYDVILVGTSIYCMFGRGGFQLKMKYKYDFLEPANDLTPYADLRKLGTRLTLNEKDCPIISLLYICKYPSSKNEFIDWEGFEKCLRTANAEFKGKTIATTVLGSTCFDGNGDKERCMKLIEECMTDVDITIYDYEQLSAQKEIGAYRGYVFRQRKDKEKYKALVKGMDDYLISQFLKPKHD